jgi:hypothetical protein
MKSLTHELEGAARRGGARDLLAHLAATTP